MVEKQRPLSQILHYRQTGKGNFLSLQEGLDECRGDILQPGLELLGEDTLGVDGLEDIGVLGLEVGKEVYSTG